MDKLNYKTLKKTGCKDFVLENAPERIIQFGEGNFMRAFVDYFIDVLNERVGFNSKIVVCQPIAEGLSDKINEQEGLYTLYLRGHENGKKVNQKRVVSSISRCINPYKDYDAFVNLSKNVDLRFITCNTTEAGIVFDDSCKLEDAPPSSFPAKLTQLLYRRFSTIKDANGFIILSCELIDNNGKELEKCVLQYAVLWNLGENFASWIREKNIFCSTLVDRIVTGYPRAEAEKICEQLGYEDNLINTGEIFGFWVIEGPKSIEEEIPFTKAGLPVIVTNDHTPYKQRKVRILNGTHTAMTLGAYLAGFDYVRDCMQDAIIGSYIQKIMYNEIIPTLTLSEKELFEFAKSVEDRFNNPYIDHALLSISLNSTAKWKARVLPSVKKYVENTLTIPKGLVSSFAFYISFFRGVKMENGKFYGLRNGSEYEICDDKFVLDFFYENKEISTSDLVLKVCKNKDFWGEDLTGIPGFYDSVLNALSRIEAAGVYEEFALCVNEL